MSGNTYRSEILSDNPIAYWTFGETGGSAADNLGSVGSGLDGTYVGDPLLGTTGLNGTSDTASLFDGVNDGVLLNNHSALNTASSYSQKTIELWFNADDTNGTQILYEQGGSTNGMNLYLEGGTLKMGAWRSNSGSWLSTAIEAGQSYHVVFVFDAGTLYGYLNGELIGTAETGFSALPTHANGSAIGRNNSSTRLSNSSTTSSTYNFAGTIDEVALYNSALSADRVAEHYDARSQSLAGSYSDSELQGGGGDDTLAGDRNEQWLSLDGVNDHVNLNAGIINLANADFTIEAWVKTTGTSEAILVKTDEDNSWESGEKAFYISHTGKVEFVGWGNSYIKGNSVVNDGEWHHVAVVWDYSSGTSGTGTIYVDGVNDTASSTYSAKKADVAGNTLKIARPNFGEAQNYFSGDIDDVRLWTVARTADDIQANLDQTLSGSEAGLAGHWIFDSHTVTGNTVADLSGNGNTGSLVGGQGNNFNSGYSGGDDFLGGNDGNDLLLGYGGQDKLAGGAGEDTLTGGTGADHFIFTDASDGIDIITDFNQGEGDRILIASSFGATSIDEFTYDSTTGALSYNATQIATLQTPHNFELESSVVLHENATVDENTTNGSVVATVSVDDAISSNAYQVIGGDGIGAFALNATTGEITVADSSKLNYEDATSPNRYEIVIEATTTAGKVITKPITLQVLDINEAPEASDSTVSVAEHTANGVVIAQVNAEDPDADDRLSYVIQGGNDDRIFGINANTGEILVNDYTQLDYEGVRQHQLTIGVADKGGLRDAASVTINVEQGNELPVVENQTFYFDNLGMQRGEGSILGTIQVSDENPSGLTYSILSGNDDNLFEIDANGRVRVKSSLSSAAIATAIANQNTAYNLIVQVTDHLGTSDTATITLEKSPVANLYQSGNYGITNPFSSVNVGANATPELVDIDNDGDLDLFVGRGTVDGSLEYYRNNGGSFSAASHSLENIDFDLARSLTFADIDQDGDLDAIVDDYDGIRYFKRTSTTTYTEQTGSNNPFDGLSSSGTAFADIDADGDLDAFLGYGSDKDSTNRGIDYYQNDNGTFTLQNQNNPFGSHTVSNYPDPTFFDVDADGDLDALVGGDDGKIAYFQNNNGVLTQKTGNANPFNNIDIGSNSSPTIGDINGDGLPDLIIGTSDGTLSYFQGSELEYRDLSFATNNQSMWGGGSAAVVDWSLGDHLEDLLGFRPQVEWDFDLSEKFGSWFKAGVETYGDIGIDAGFSIDSGSVDANLPIDLWMEMPDDIAAGESVTLSSGYSLDDAASFTTTTPYLSAYLDFAFLVYAGAYFQVDYKLGKYKKSLDAIDFGESFEFAFDTRDLESYYDFPSPDVTSVSVGNDTFNLGYDSGSLASLGFYSPEVDVTGAVVNDRTLTGSGSDTFMDGSLDLVGIMSEIGSNLPYVGAAFEAFGAINSGSISAGIAGVDWSLFSADFVTDFSLQQDFELGIDSLTGTLSFEGSNQTRQFTVGEDITFTVPTDVSFGADNKLDITATFDLDASFKNKTSLGYDADIDMSLLEGKAWYDVWVGKGSKSFGPIWEDSFDLFSGSAALYNSGAFDLGGLNTASTTFQVAKA